MINQKFPKKYKMTLKADIDAIMSASDRVFGKNLVFRFRFTERQDTALKVLFVVPKRRFKKAVIRNRIKRQLREMTRLEKQKIIDVLPADKTLHIAIIYTGPVEMQYHLQKKRFMKTLGKIPALNLNNN